MNLMLSGGAGYISSHTAVAQSELGYQVALCDNLSNSSDSVLEKLTQITGQVITFVISNVRDTDLHRVTPTSLNIDAVYALQGWRRLANLLKSPLTSTPATHRALSACCKQCSELACCAQVGGYECSHVAIPAASKVKRYVIGHPKKPNQHDTKNWV